MRRGEYEYTETMLPCVGGLISLSLRTSRSAWSCFIAQYRYSTFPEGHSKHCTIRVREMFACWRRNGPTSTIEKVRKVWIVCQTARVLVRSHTSGRSVRGVPVEVSLAGILAAWRAFATEGSSPAHAESQFQDHADPGADACLQGNLHWSNLHCVHELDIVNEGLPTKVSGQAPW